MRASPNETHSVVAAQSPSSRPPADGPQSPFFVGALAFELQRNPLVEFHARGPPNTDQARLSASGVLHQSCCSRLRRRAQRAQRQRRWPRACLRQDAALEQLPFKHDCFLPEQWLPWPHGEQPEGRLLARVRQLNNALRARVVLEQAQRHCSRCTHGTKIRSPQLMHTRCSELLCSMGRSLLFRIPP